MSQCEFAERNVAVGNGHSVHVNDHECRSVDGDVNDDLWSETLRTSLTGVTALLVIALLLASINISGRFTSPFATPMQSLAPDAVSHSIIRAEYSTPLSARPTSSLDVDIFVMCPISEHQNLSIGSFNNYWPRMKLPGKLHAGVVEWVIQEIDVYIERGEILLPLFIDAWFTTGFFRLYPVFGSVLEYFAPLIDKNQFTCTVVYESGSQPPSHTSTVSITNPHSSQDHYVICTFQPMIIPKAIHIELHDDANNVHRSLRLEVCTVTVRRSFAAIVLKGLHGKYDSDKMMDWIDYHYRVGFDQLYIFDHIGHGSTDPRMIRLQQMGVVHYFRWPPHYGDNKEFYHGGGDQTALYLAASLRLKRHTVWVASIDLDEYIWFNTTFYPRTCNNSVNCMTPLRDFLQPLSRFGSIHSFATNYLQLTVPDDMRVPEDLFRYDNTTKLPYVVRWVYRRQMGFGEGTQKYLYQTIGVHSADVHRVGHIRESLFIRSHKESLRFHISHYKNLFVEREDWDAKNVSALWSQMIRDTSIADVMQTLPSVFT